LRHKHIGVTAQHYADYKERVVVPLDASTDLPYFRQ
jgi:hypothetical protein